MAERYINDPQTKALVQGGLTLHQAGLYEALARRGPQTASKASFFSSVPRTLAYNVLTELEKLGLVIKHDQPGKVAKFSAAHPSKLKEFAEKRIEEANEAKVALEGALLKLAEDYSAVSAPKVRIIEGKKGFAELSVLEDGTTGVDQELSTYNINFHIEGEPISSFTFKNKGISSGYRHFFEALLKLSSPLS